METARERIGNVLRDAFDAAVKERNTASEAFEEVLRDIPSGMARPNCVQGIKNASRSLSVAREKMSAAIIRLKEFENFGIIPEDLQKDGGKHHTSSEPPPRGALRARLGRPH